MVKSNFDTAEIDYEAVCILLKADTKTYNVAAVHCQQACEKYLKHLLIISKLPLIVNDFNYVLQHNLNTLRLYIQRAYPELQKVKDDLSFLNKYYIKARYYGDGYIEVEKELAERCFEATVRVKAACVSIMNREEVISNQTD